MDYKDTLNLPKTGFPMKADLVNREPERLEGWRKASLYQAIQRRREGAEKFVLHDGPPFTNGDVHIGTALNKILKDVIIRYQTLRGKSAPYIPGWDTHGLPIEFKVSQEMRKEGNTGADAATIRRACEEYARKYIAIQTAQFQRLGVLGDWDNPYITLDRAYEANELRLFADILEKGFVYRGKKPVYWSIPCRTALAEAEVEYQDHLSQSVYVRFPLVGHPNTSLLIWTTTPWTLPANLAVAYNAGFSYSMVQVFDQTFILSTMLLDKVSEICGWESYQIIRSLEAEDLAQMEYEHPFIARTGKLLAGGFVENTTGTGFVHIAPGHGLEDYGLGREHGLPVYSPVDDNGALAHTEDLPVDQQMPEALVGKAILAKKGRSEANEAVLALLAEKEMLVHREDYSHSYPHCWRSKTPVIFRAMDQWFVRIDHEKFRDRALEAIAGVNWVPDWGRNRIEAAVRSRPDWCISRQRSWGVPIPAFYDAEGNPILDPKIVRKAADLVERSGSNVWFEKSVGELWAEAKPDDWSGPEPVAKSQDTLDVWIDSGSSSRAVLMRREELNEGEGRGEHAWRADIYLEGTDQHRGWFQSSLLLSLAGNGVAPYRTVITHGFMVDEDRAKISKSAQGGYEKPQTAEAYVGEHGADIVRLWVASQDFRNDITVSKERIKKVAETYRLIRNTLRYQLSNLFDFDPSKDSVPREKMTELDRWILSEFSKLVGEVEKAYAAHEFHLVYQRVSQFAAVELSAVYHDAVKDRLYTDAARSPRRRSTQTALHLMVTGLCGMMSPILVFTADEAWQFIPGDRVESVHLSDWPAAEWALSEAEQADWASLFELRTLALAELEKARQAKTIGKALEARLDITGGAGQLASAASHQEVFRELLNVSQLGLNSKTGSPPIEIKVGRAEGEKCGRCWHREPEVGADQDHPTLCARCIASIG